MPFTKPLRSELKAAFLLSTMLALSGCANMGDGGMFPSFGGEDNAAAIEAQPVDPLDVDPLNADPMSASAGDTDGGSQLVPLGTLTAADMTAQPKRNGPAPLVPPSTQATAPQAAPSQTSSSQTSPVLTPPPGMTDQAAAQPPPQVTVSQSDSIFKSNVKTSAAKAAVATSRPSVVAKPAPEAQTVAPPSAAVTLTQPPGLPSGAPPMDAREFAPQQEAREFVPAQITSTEPLTAGAPGAPKLTVGDNNVIRRFQILSRLLDEGLITQEEHDRRRAANAGALLQYSKEPPGIGMERPVPAPAAISARLQALGRSLEMRAITTRQHELERTTILNSLLPEKPEPRAPKAPPPADMFAMADAAGRLAYIRDQNLISEAEFEAEKAAMDRVMRGGEGVEKRPVASSSSSSSGSGKSASAAKPGAAAGASASATPAAPDTLTGPVLHLASFRSAEGARSAFEQAKTRNPNLFANLRFEPRKTNVPGQGNFYRLLVGPFATLAEAEAACVEMKKVDQFCRPTPDGS
jgi:cell division septation protein DedD